MLLLLSARRRSSVESVGRLPRGASFAANVEISWYECRLSADLMMRYTVKNVVGIFQDDGVLKGLAY